MVLKAGGIGDDVHLLVKFHPQYAIASTVQLPKASAPRWIHQHGKVKARFQWQHGYGAFSVSQSMAATVKDYIANQRAHHRQCALTDEYLQMLRLDEIDFDERYVFDEENLG